MARLVTLPLVGLLVGCKLSAPEPDARWQVDLTHGSKDAQTCYQQDDAHNMQETYVYEVTWPNKDDGDVTTTEITIDGEPFAAGQTSGCSIEYASPTWLDQRDQGYIKWSLVGKAEEQQGAGGCETITVEESTDTSIPEGCSYTVVVQGTFLGAGGG
jgi:hypothetical protein